MPLFAHNLQPFVFELFLCVGVARQIKPVRNCTRSARFLWNANHLHAAAGSVRSGSSHSFANTGLLLLPSGKCWNKMSLQWYCWCGEDSYLYALTDAFEDILLFSPQYPSHLFVIYRLPNLSCPPPVIRYLQKNSTKNIFLLYFVTVTLKNNLATCEKCL